MRYFMLLLLLCFPRLANAAAYTIERAVIGANGGTVSGGPYTLSYTVGQPTTGRLEGFNVHGYGGFWWEVTGQAVNADDRSLPTRYSLNPISPNPFTTRTVVRYALPDGTEHQSVFIGVFDVRGGLVKTLTNERQAPGQYTVTWNGMDESGSPMAAGVYFVRFQTLNFLQHRRVVMLK